MLCAMEGYQPLVQGWMAVREMRYLAFHSATPSQGLGHPHADLLKVISISRKLSIGVFAPDSPWRTIYLSGHDTVVLWIPLACVCKCKFRSSRVSLSHRIAFVAVFHNTRGGTSIGH